jgi:hypothetical protein
MTIANRASDSVQALAEAVLRDCESRTFARTFGARLTPEQTCAQGTKRAAPERWRLYFGHGAPIEADLPAGATLKQIRQTWPYALAAIRVNSVEPACETCAWISRYWNCGDPVAAGLADRHSLI